MSEEDLELLITLDDPEGAPEENALDLRAGNTIDSRMVSPCGNAPDRRGSIGSEGKIYENS